MPHLSKNRKQHLMLTIAYWLYLSNGSFIRSFVPIHPMMLFFLYSWHSIPSHSILPQTIRPAIRYLLCDRIDTTEDPARTTKAHILAQHIHRIHKYKSDTGIMCLSHSKALAANHRVYVFRFSLLDWLSFYGPWHGVANCRITMTVWHTRNITD